MRRLQWYLAADELNIAHFAATKQYHFRIGWASSEPTGQIPISEEVLKNIQSVHMWNFRKSNVKSRIGFGSDLQSDQLTTVQQLLITGRGNDKHSVDCKFDFLLVDGFNLKDSLLASHNKLIRCGSFKIDGLIRIGGSRCNNDETRWTCTWREECLVLALLLLQSATCYSLTSWRMCRS